MRALSLCLLRLAIAATCAAGITTALAQGNAKRGEYLATAAGCAGCHTDTRQGSQAFAGGRALDTDFGTFYAPNITPDPAAGIGGWTEVDFIRAMREGTRPDGWPYYPAFPYPSFTKISGADLRDLWAYLRSLPPSGRADRPHQLHFPFGWRFLVYAWKWLFFTPGAFAATPGASALVNRGAYLVQALGHCGECHTPRNFLGAPKADRFLAGGKLPEGRTPNLTPTELKKWSDPDLREFLRSGVTPDGDVAAESMSEVVMNTTRKLTPDDLAALMAYLRTLPPLPTEK